MILAAINHTGVIIFGGVYRYAINIEIVLLVRHMMAKDHTLEKFE